MKRIVAALIFICLNNWSFSQNIDSLRTSWEKIVIVDAYGGWHHFNNEYTILNTNGKLILLDKTDTPIKEVSPNLIQQLFNSLQNKPAILTDPLVMFGKDSLWLIDNAEKLCKS